MIASIAPLTLILATANAGTFLGLDASHVDQIVRSSPAETDKQPTAALLGAVQEASTDPGVNVFKPAGLRGFDGVNVLAEIGSNNADGTVPAKIWVKRSDRIAGALTTVS